MKPELLIRLFLVGLEVFVLVVVLNWGFSLLNIRNDNAVTLGYVVILGCGVTGVGSLFFWFPELRRLFNR